MTRNSKSVVSRSHEEATVESFRKDPGFAAEYLNSILEDGDQLYRTLSPKGNPELKSLKALLRAMGMQLTVRPLRKRVA